MSIVLEGIEEIIKEFLVESTEGLDLLDRDLIALERDPASAELLAEIFRAVHTLKGTSGVLGFPKLESVAHVGENLLSRLRDGKLQLHPALVSGLLAMVDALRQLLREVEQNGSEGDGDYRNVVSLLEGLLEPAPAATIADTKAAVPEPESASAEIRGEAAKEPAGISGSNIRVDIGLLDKMMNLVGELVLARNQILQFTSSQSDATLLSAAQRLNLITTELQEGVMKTRMQPIGNVWNKFPRLMRDLALQCGKQVDIEMEGSETELDKTIIEAIKDPLTHILRNSIDHGIENPQVRREAGKPPNGCLRMRAAHEGGQVNIEISDDGTGIDLEKVKQRALQRGLITSEQASRMGERELSNLVFLPGFSTAEKVTNVSGRGVGMDVVKTNIEKIGGTVDLQSIRGIGTKLKIKIPLTLAIIPALIVSTSGERFAIPQVSLLELVRLEGSTPIERIHGVPVYRLRGRLLPLVFLKTELNLERQDSGQKASGTEGSVSRLIARARYFDFASARERHTAWVERLGKVLDGSLGMKLEEAGSHETCALGQWLYGHCLREHGDIPEVREVELVHRNFHVLVRDIVGKRNAGEVRAAQERLREVKPVSQQIVELLNTIEREIAGVGGSNIVVLQAADRQFGLVVDEINDTEEIVVKPVGKQCKGVACFAGATIMGDGRVALILDVLGIAAKAGVLSESHEQMLSESTETRANSQQTRQSWLLFRSAGGRHLALPLSGVDRLEEFPATQVERAGSGEVVQYRGAIMPLIRISKLLNEPVETRELLPVVVFKRGQQNFGLLVDRIEEITDEVADVHSDRRGELVMGSAVIGQRVTDLLDLNSVTALAGDVALTQSAGRA